MTSEETGGKAVVLTGATRGVGRALAVALASQGHNLVLNARDETALAAVADQLRARGSHVVTVPGSVADEAVAAALIDSCLTHYGVLDALVNSAGIVRDRTTLKMGVAEFDEVVAVNLRGAWLCGRRAAQAMSARGGSIVNLVSEVAFYGAVGQSNYMASKAGLVALTLAWAVELERYGIRVNAVSPAALTDMSRVVLDRMRAVAADTGEVPPEARDLGMGTPAEIAPLVLYLVGDLSADLTGQVFSFNGQRLELWSFPARASSAVAPTWSPGLIREAFDCGVLQPQRPARPAVQPHQGH